MHLESLGHVVLRVRDLQRSEGFYSNVLGMKVITRNSNPAYDVLHLWNSGQSPRLRPDRAGQDATSPHPDTTGLAHVAFKVGSSPRNSV
jgi:catechol 2,3-dioxygenase